MYIKVIENKDSNKFVWDNFTLYHNLFYMGMHLTKV